MGSIPTKQTGSPRSRNSSIFSMPPTKPTPKYSPAQSTTVPSPDSKFFGDSPRPNAAAVFGLSPEQDQYLNSLFQKSLKTRGLDYSPYSGSTTTLDADQSTVRPPTTFGENVSNDSISDFDDHIFLQQQYHHHYAGSSVSASHPPPHSVVEEDVHGLRPIMKDLQRQQPPPPSVIDSEVDSEGGSSMRANFDDTSPRRSGLDTSTNSFASVVAPPSVHSREWNACTVPTTADGGRTTTSRPFSMRAGARSGHYTGRVVSSDRLPSMPLTTYSNSNESLITPGSSKGSASRENKELPTLLTCLLQCMQQLPNATPGDGSNVSCQSGSDVLSANMQRPQTRPTRHAASTHNRRQNEEFWSFAAGEGQGRGTEKADWQQMRKVMQKFHEIDALAASRRVTPLNERNLVTSKVMKDDDDTEVGVHLSVPNLGLCMTPFYEEDKRLFERSYLVDDIRTDSVQLNEDLAEDGYFSSPEGGSEAGRQHQRHVKSSCFHSLGHQKRPNRYYVQQQTDPELDAATARVLRSVYVLQERERVLSLEHLDWSMRLAQRVAPKRLKRHLAQPVKNAGGGGSTDDLPNCSSKLSTVLEVEDREPSWRRRFVVGMKEVERALSKPSQLSCVIAAPNIDRCVKKGGLDNRMLNILTEAAAQNIPVVFSLHRNGIGKAFGRRSASRSTMSVLGVVNNDRGNSELIGDMLRLAEKSVTDWRLVHNWVPSKILLERFLNSNEYKYSISIRQGGRIRQTRSNFNSIVA
eukprot:Filipodium_phascolosomae@DN726_c0_g1_i1.p1